MGGNAKAMYLRMASGAVLPWLSADVGGKRGPKNAEAAGQGRLSAATARHTRERSGGKWPPASWPRA